MFYYLYKIYIKTTVNYISPWSSIESIKTKSINQSKSNKSIPTVGQKSIQPEKGRVNVSNAYIYYKHLLTMSFIPFYPRDAV